MLPAKSSIQQRVALGRMKPTAGHPVGHIDAVGWGANHRRMRAGDEEVSARAAISPLSPGQPATDGGRPGLLAGHRVVDRLARLGYFGQLPKLCSMATTKAPAGLA